MSWRHRQILLDIQNSENGTIIKDAPNRVALVSPGGYSFAAASLGYQTIYRLFNEIPGFSCERGFHLPLPGRGIGEVLTVESLTNISSFGIVGFSISYELELGNVIRMLASSGIEPLAERRGNGAPLIICGGSQMISNPLPFAPFFDLMVIGDGEDILPVIAEQFRGSRDKESFLNAMNSTGVYIPALHSENIPMPLRASEDNLPAFSQFVSPRSEFRGRFLVEVSRGCPRLCTFCLVNKDLIPPVYTRKERILDRIPRGTKKVGLVGASVSDHPEIKAIVFDLVARGCSASLGSLRADRLDLEFALLLKESGNRMLTMSLDAASESLRKRIKKGVTEEVMISAFKNAKQAGFRKVKLYAMLGFDGEEERDLNELAALLNELSRLVPINLSINPFVPKKRTPLEKARFADPREYTEKLNLLRKKLRGRVKITGASPKEAEEEYLISQGGMDLGFEYYNKIRRELSPN